MARVPLPPLARHFQAIGIVFSNDGGTIDGASNDGDGASNKRRAINC